MTTIGLCAGITAFVVFWLIGVFGKRPFQPVMAYAVLAVTAVYLAWIDGTTVRLDLLGGICLVLGGFTATCECISRFRGLKRGWLFKSGAGLFIAGLLLMIVA